MSETTESCLCSPEFSKCLEDNLYLRIPKELVDSITYLSDKRVEITISNWIMEHSSRIFTKETLRVIVQEVEDGHIEASVNTVLVTLLDIYEKLVDEKTGKHGLWQQFLARLRR